MKQIKQMNTFKQKATVKEKIWGMRLFCSIFADKKGNEAAPNHKKGAKSYREIL